MSLILYGTQDDSLRSIGESFYGNCGRKVVVTEESIVISTKTPIKIEVETINHETKSKEPFSNTNERESFPEANDSEMTTLYALLVVAVIVLFAIIFEKRYGFGSIKQFCPEINRVNTTDQRPLLGRLIVGDPDDRHIILDQTLAILPEHRLTAI